MVQGSDTGRLARSVSRLITILHFVHLFRSILDILEPPTRDIAAPLRIPISNVFKSHGTGAAVSGRLCGGVVQVGERLRILPGDETAIVKGT